MRHFILLILTLFTLSVFAQRNADYAQKVNCKGFDNLYKISDSIYRCEQPEDTDYLELEQLGIKSVLNLRNYHSDKSGNANVILYRVKMNAHDIEDEDVVAALKILQNAPKPLVFHCKHGSDRTGVIGAMYRIIFQNWSKEKALDELLNGGYGYHAVFVNIPKYIKDVDIDYIKKQLSVQ